MAESRYVVVNITVSALGAGVRGVALFGAGRFGNDCDVVVDVARIRDRLFSRLSAAAAGVKSDAGFGLGGLASDNAVVPVVAESRYVIGNVTVVAS